MGVPGAGLVHGRSSDACQEIREPIQLAEVGRDAEVEDPTAGRWSSRGAQVAHRGAARGQGPRVPLLWLRPLLLQSALVV